MGPIAPGMRLLIRPERAEASLWRRFRATGQSRLRERLFDRYHRFARSLARRYARRHDLAADLRDDLEQLAYRGLLEAIDRFDPRRGASFLSFAAARIAGSMIDGLSSMDENGARRRFKRRVERERIASLAPKGSSCLDQSASATGQLADLVTELALSLMLDMEERAAPDDLAGRLENGFDNLAWRETRALLSQRVDQLPEPERSVIRHHYQNDLLFAQIAAMLGLSQGRISQIHKAALARLRKSMRAVR